MIESASGLRSPGSWPWARESPPTSRPTSRSVLSSFMATSSPSTTPATPPLISTSKTSRIDAPPPSSTSAKETPVLVWLVGVGHPCYIGAARERFRFRSVCAARGPGRRRSVPRKDRRERIPGRRIQESARQGADHVAPPPTPPPRDDERDDQEHVFDQAPRQSDLACREQTCAAIEFI